MEKKNIFFPNSFSKNLRFESQWFDFGHMPIPELALEPRRMKYPFLEWDGQPPNHVDAEWGEVATKGAIIKKEEWMLDG